MNIVIDTNIFVSAIFWDKIPLKIIKHIFDNNYKIYVSIEILQEYFRVIEKIAKNNFDLINKWKSTILINTNLIEPSIKLDICRDKKDNMFLDCAYSCQAKYIISGDDDLLSLKVIGDIQIIQPNNFLILENIQYD
jgi:putative PIN family toxin of toxin-antitoxin system